MLFHTLNSGAQTFFTVFKELWSLQRVISQMCLFDEKSEVTIKKASSSKLTWTIEKLLHLAFKFQRFDIGEIKEHQTYAHNYRLDDRARTCL